MKQSKNPLPMEDFAGKVFDALREAADAGFDGIVLDLETGQIIGQSPVRLAPRINMELLRSEILQLIDELKIQLH